MSEHAAHNSHESPNAFIERCLSLGLAVWPCDVGRVLLDQVRADEGALPWLRSKRLCPLVEHAARGAAQEDGPQPIEVFEGCSFVPVLRQQGATQRVAFLAMVLCENALQTREFEAICAEAEMSTEDGRRCVGPIVQPAGSDAQRIRTILQWSFDDVSCLQRDAHTLEEFSEKLIQSYEESACFYRLARMINSSFGPYQSLEATCHQIQQILPFAWIAMRFVPETKVPELAGQLIIAGGISCSQEMFNQAAADLLRQWSRGNRKAVLVPRSHALADLAGSEVVVERFMHEDRVVGLLLAGNKGGDDPEIASNELQFLDAAADFLGVYYENLARFEEQRTMLFGTLQALIASIDAKDRYTCGHSERVSLLGAQLALVIGLDEKQIDQIRISGQVHDVGKIGVPEAVLCKPGKLTKEEFELMKRHPVIGFEILKDIPPLAEMLPGVLYHHERWDGRGYPEGLDGELIPLYGRILACADTFDAMSSTRSYRPAMPRERVLQEFDRCSGSQFDPELARRFVTLDFSQYDAMVDKHRATSPFAA